MIGFGNNVASLDATLTLNSDKFIAGLAAADAALDDYNAKLKASGVEGRLASSASKDMASQLYKETLAANQTTSAHNRLSNALQYGRKNWKGLAVDATGAAVGVLALTGHLGSLSALLPALSQGLAGILSPFTSLAAIVVGMVSPLTALVTLFGGVGAGVGLGLYTALTSNNKAFSGLQKQLSGVKTLFDNLGLSLGKRFLPYIQQGVQWVSNFLKYANQLAHMSLPQAIQSMSTKGMTMLSNLNKMIFNMIGKPIEEIFNASFGSAGNRISASFASMFARWKPVVADMWHVFSSWFDKQHFTQTGAAWASALTNAFINVVIPAMLRGLEADFKNQGFWGKLGMIAGAAFAAQFFGVFSLAASGAKVGGSLLKGVGKLAGVGGGATVGAEGAEGTAAVGGASLLAGIPVALAALTAVGVIGLYKSLHDKLTPTLIQLHPLWKQAVSDMDNQTSRITNVTKLQSQYNAAVANANKVREKYGKDSPQYLAAFEAEEKAGSRLASAQDAVNRTNKNVENSMDALRGKFVDATKVIDKFGGSTEQNKEIADKYASAIGSVALKEQARADYLQKTGNPAAAAAAQHIADQAKAAQDLTLKLGHIPTKKQIDIYMTNHFANTTDQITIDADAVVRVTGGAFKGKQLITPASGGIITGGTPGKDSVPAMLMPGEVVLSKAAVASIGGPHAANSLNPNGQIFSFAGGGGVVGHLTPTKVLDAPTLKSSDLPKGFHNNDYYEGHLHKAQKELQRAQGMSHKTTKETNARTKAINAAKNKIQSIKSKLAGNQPKLKSWFENVVGNIDATMQFNEQYWDTQYQQTGANKWLTLEENQDAQEVLLYKRAGAWAKKHGFMADATQWDRAAVSAYQGQQGLIQGASGGAPNTADENYAAAYAALEGYVSQFGGNVGAVGLSPTEVSNGAGGSGGSGKAVTVVQNITMTNPDPHVLARQASFAAQAAF